MKQATLRSNDAYLCFRIVRRERSGARLDDVRQLNDRTHGVLRGDGQLLLIGGGAGHERLRVFDQGLGGLENGIPE